MASIHENSQNSACGCGLSVVGESGICDSECQKKAAKLSDYVKINISAVAAAASIIVFSNSVKRTRHSGEIFVRSGENCVDIQVAEIQSITTAAIWTGLGTAMAFLLKAFSSKSPFDRPMCAAGIFCAATPGLFLSLPQLGVLDPTYFTQAVYTTLYFSGSLIIYTACAGRYADLRGVPVYAIVSLFAVLLPVAFAPGAFSTEPFQIPVGSDGDNAHAAIGAGYAENDGLKIVSGRLPLPLHYVRQRHGVYDLRIVWPEGHLGTALWAWHLHGGFVWLITLLFWQIQCTYLVRRRLPAGRLRLIADGIATLGACMQAVSIYLANSPGIEEWHLGMLVLGFVQNCALSAVLPLGMLHLFEATQEHEQQTLLHLLEDANKSRRHAEEVAATRRSFLRYIFHEVCSRFVITMRIVCSRLLLNEKLDGNDIILFARDPLDP